MSHVYTVETTIKNQTEKRIVSTIAKRVILKHYWDHHGDCIAWKEPEVLNNVHVVVIKKEYDWAIGKDVTDPNKFDHCSICRLYINEKEMNGEVVSFRGLKQMAIKLCDGHG
ncbi:MAG: hypothetical protein HUJ61_00200 [Bacilli bacterium]|nr:hypothetical protein [Bacilli bacterium]